jgi:hypothetical protein
MCMTRTEAAQFTATLDSALDEERQERQLSARGRKMATQALAQRSGPGAVRALGGDKRATAGARALAALSTACSYMIRRMTGRHGPQHTSPQSAN